jgi:hypothetical protein
METLAKEVHKPVKHKFERRKVETFGVDNIFAVDLVDMSKLRDGDFSYILTIIDVASKYAWAIPLKNKKALTVLKAFKDVVNESHRKPDCIWCDSGSEFWNKDFSKYLGENGIEIYSTYGESHSAVVERFNRTLKTNMWKQFTEKGTEKWVEMIPKLMDEYNNEHVHRTTGMTPVEASKKSNEGEVLEKEKDTRPIKSKKSFEIGDKVRITRLKKHFEKGYKANWSVETFTICEVLNTKPITYKIKDFHDEVIEGSFYNEELQKTKIGDVYLIEKILKTKTVKGKKKYYVKFVGYDETFNNWIDADTVKES